MKTKVVQHVPRINLSYLKFQNFKFLKIFKFSNFQIFKNFQIFNFSIFQIFSGSQLLSDFQTFLTGNYGYNENVEWTIVVSAGQVVRLDFYTFNTESCCDYVRVYDGCTTGDPSIGSYSGDNIPASILSTGNALLIRFTSDGSVTRQGFSATASGVGNMTLECYLLKLNM